MRKAALIFGGVGALSLFLGGIISFIIGLSSVVDSSGYVDFAGDLLEGMGGAGTSYSVSEVVPSERDLERALSQAFDSLASGDFGRLQDLERDLGSTRLDVSGKGSLYRLLAMGIIALIASIVGIVGALLAMGQPKAALYLMGSASASALLSIAVAFHAAPGLIILGTFAMVLFAWGAVLEYLETKPQGSSATTEAAGTEGGSSGADEAEASGEASPA